MAGRLRLAVTGIQDQWLTGEPQFSYFVMNYRRHTRFAIEAVELPFEGQTDFGKTLLCRIPNNVGDLVRSMMLKVTLEPLPEDDDNLVSNTYNTSIGSRIIDYADLMIGGQTIERITGEYIYMYDQIHSNLDDTSQTLYFLSGHNNHIVFSEPYTFYINLPFYFFRHPSLAIPVCAITKQLIEVRIKFKQSNYKISYSYERLSENDPWEIYPTNDGVINNVSLITDFYFITDEEKRFLLTRPIEYVITQLQLATIPFKPNISSRSVMLNFKHPVRELYMIATLQEGEQLERDGRKLLYNYEPITDDTMYRSNEINIRSDHRFIKRVSLEFNGSTIFNHDRKYLAYQQSLDHHTGCPSPAYEFYTYSFALNPEVYYPTGQVNMSRIIHQKLNMELEEVDDKNETLVNVYAVNYNVLRVSSGIAGLKF